MLDVSLLGTGGMLPLHNRFLTSFVSRLNGSMLLIDCGEGTQVTLKQLGWGFKSLDYICFTHFHADHIAGLPGLLLTVGNSGRTEPITIVGPKGLKNVVNCLRVIAPELPYALQFKELSFAGNAHLEFTLGKYNVSALPLDHRIACIGYSLNISRAGRFDAQRAKEQDIPVKLWSRLQNGEAIEEGGKTYRPEMVLGPERKGLKVSYITDTRPVRGIPGFVSGSDLFICEGIYGEDEKLTKAMEHMHMTFSEAAVLAERGGVKELWLTHFSPSMPDPENYIENAGSIFQNTKVGHDRMNKTLVFED